MPKIAPTILRANRVDITQQGVGLHPPPENLNRITPPELDFEIITDLPDEMLNGLIIEYRIGIPLLGKQGWLTEIKHIRPQHSFVDEQRVGPYQLWYHYHEITEVEDGVRFIDRVHYALPFGPLGALAHILYVRKSNCATSSDFAKRPSGRSLIRMILSVDSRKSLRIDA